MAHTEKEILDYWMKKDSLGLNWTQEDRIIFAMREFANKSAQEHPTISKTERVQTAVEWFAEQILTDLKITKELIEKAKQMEKEQSKRDYYAGLEGYIVKDGGFEQYYNETYGK